MYALLLGSVSLPPNSVEYLNGYCMGLEGDHPSKYSGQLGEATLWSSAGIVRVASAFAASIAVFADALHIDIAPPGMPGHSMLLFFPTEGGTLGWATPTRLRL